LLEFNVAQNNITDVGFETICRELLTPLDASDSRLGSSPSGSHDDLEALAEASNDESHDDFENEGFAPAPLGNRLRSLSAFRNPIGNVGIAALAVALDKGGLPQLTSLNISGTSIIQRDGTPRPTALMEREKIRKAHVAWKESGGEAKQDGSDEQQDSSSYSDSDEHKPTLDPYELGISDEGISKFAYLLHHNKPTSGKPGMLTQLTDLRLFSNSIGDDGLIALSMAFSERSTLCRNLQKLWLQDNFIGDKGMIFMVDTLFNGGMVNLRQLLLADNLISNAGSEGLANALGRGALAKLRKLSLSGNAITEASIFHLCTCLLDRDHSMSHDFSHIELDLMPSEDQIETKPRAGGRSEHRGTLSKAQQAMMKRYSSPAELTIKQVPENRKSVAANRRTSTADSGGQRSSVSDAPPQRASVAKKVSIQDGPSSAIAWVKSGLSTTEASPPEPPSKDGGSSGTVWEKAGLSITEASPVVPPSSLPPSPPASFTEGRRPDEYVIM